MKNSKQTVAMARDLVATMKTAGHELTLADAYTLARVAQIAAGRFDEQLRRDARNDRVRKGMVANAVADLRACGAWDGE